MAIDLPKPSFVLAVTNTIPAAALSGKAGTPPKVKNLSLRHVTSLDQGLSFFPRSLWGGEMKDPGNEIARGREEARRIRA